MIKKSASLGANCTIVCGNTVGEYAFIGAGTVVTKDVPNHALYVGNPGKIVGWVDKRGNKIDLNSKNISQCGDYRLVNNLLQYVVKWTLKWFFGNDWVAGAFHSLQNWCHRLNFVS